MIFCAQEYNSITYIKCIKYYTHKLFCDPFINNEYSISNMMQLTNFYQTRVRICLRSQCSESNISGWGPQTIKT